MAGGLAACSTGSERRGAIEYKQFNMPDGRELDVHSAKLDSATCFLSWFLSLVL